MGARERSGLARLAAAGSVVLAGCSAARDRLTPTTSNERREETAEPTAEAGTPTATPRPTGRGRAEATPATDRTPTPPPTAEPGTPNPTGTPTATSRPPVRTPTPTRSPEPTASPTSTEEPERQASGGLSGGSAGGGGGSAGGGGGGSTTTPVETATPAPTTGEPTATPTSAPDPTATPTPAPEPTATPTPTADPTPTPTPAPDEPSLPHLLGSSAAETVTGTTEVEDARSGHVGSITADEPVSVWFSLSSTETQFACRLCDAGQLEAYWDGTDVPTYVSFAGVNDLSFGPFTLSSGTTALTVEPADGAGTVEYTLSVEPRTSG